jgi:hypothetical protein
LVRSPPERFHLSSKSRERVHMPHSPSKNRVPVMKRSFTASTPAKPKTSPVPISVRADNQENQVTLTCGAEMKLSW